MVGADEPASRRFPAAGIRINLPLIHDKLPSFAICLLLKTALESPAEYNSTPSNLRPPPAAITP